MNDEPIQLMWGQTPWDRLTQPELLREVQRMYSAIQSLASCLRMSRVTNAQSLYWDYDGSGGVALEKARQILDPLEEKFERESIYRSFFRYATDLLFEQGGYRIGSGWAVCPVCGVMLGETVSLNGTRTTVVGQPCRHGDKDCQGVFRLLEWSDMHPKVEMT